MIDWTTFAVRDGLAALALVVASLSLLISWRTSQRVKAENAVNVWIDFQLAQPEWWVATLNVENNSHLGIEVEKLSVDLPDYRLGDVSKAKLIVAPDGTPTGLVTTAIDHHLAMPFKFNVTAGDTQQRKFLLHQPAHSRRKSAKVRVMYWTLEPKRRRRILQVIVKTRSNM